MISLFVSPANGKIIAIIEKGAFDTTERTLQKNNKVLDDWTEGFSS